MANDDWGSKSMLNAANAANSMFAKFWAIVFLIFVLGLLSIAFSSITGVDAKYFFWGIPALIVGGSIILAVTIGMTAVSKSSSSDHHDSAATREAKQNASFLVELSYGESHLELANTILNKMDRNETGIVTSLLDFEAKYIESSHCLHRTLGRDWSSRESGYSALFTHDLLIACWDGAIEPCGFFNRFVDAIGVSFFEHELDPKLESINGGKKIIKRRGSLRDRQEVVKTAFDQRRDKILLNVTDEELDRLQNKLLSYEPSSCDFPLACYFYAHNTGVYRSYWEQEDLCQHYGDESTLTQKAERVSSLLESAGRLKPYMDAARSEALGKLEKSSALLKKKKIKPQDIRDLYAVADSVFPFAEGTELLAFSKIATELIAKVESGKQSKVMVEKIADLKSYLQTLDTLQSQQLVNGAVGMEHQDTLLHQLEVAHKRLGESARNLDANFVTQSIELCESLLGLPDKALSRQDLEALASVLREVRINVAVIFDEERVAKFSTSLLDALRRVTARLDEGSHK